MGKYEPLARFLESRNDDSWIATFGQIEARLGFSLPKSAHEYRAWWSNQQGPGHSQKEGWQAAGWETTDVDLDQGVVRFERRSPPGRGDEQIGGPGGDAPGLAALWRKAHDISGISDRAELEKVILTSFIQHEAARALIAMGGSDPDAKAAPRERRFR
mgnify:CR=1 FL=1